MTDSQARSEAKETLLKRIKRLKEAYFGGWISSVEVRWTYASADDLTFILKSPGSSPGSTRAEGEAAASGGSVK